MRSAVYREQATHGCSRANRARHAAADRHPDGFGGACGIQRFECGLDRGALRGGRRAGAHGNRESHRRFPAPPLGRKRNAAAYAAHARGFVARLADEFHRRRRDLHPRGPACGRAAEVIAGTADDAVKFRGVDQRHAHACRHGVESRGLRWLERAGFAGFGFFSFTPFGTAILGAGIGYMLVARRWLPRGGDAERPRQTRRNLMDFMRDYNLAPREHRVRIGADSPLVGETVVQVEARGQPLARKAGWKRKIRHRSRVEKLAAPKGEGGEALDDDRVDGLSEKKVLARCRVSFQTIRL